MSWLAAFERCILIWKAEVEEGREGRGS